MTTISARLEISMRGNRTTGYQTMSQNLPAFRHKSWRSCFFSGKGLSPVAPAAARHVPRYMTIACVLAGVMLVTACTSRPPVAPSPSENPSQTQPPAAGPTETVAQNAVADGSTAEGASDSPLIQVFVPSGDLLKIEAGVRELDDLMAERGVMVRSSVAANYAAAIDALCDGRADVAWMAPLSYVIAKDRCPAAQLLLTSVRFGSQFYAGQILVRADSGIEKLEDLNGKTMAFTDPASASGYLYPVAALEESGVTLRDSFFAGSHPAAVLAVVDGTADAAATVADVRTELEKDYPDIKRETTVLARTKDIPNDIIAAGPTMLPEAADAYRRALLEVVASERGKQVLADIYEWEGASRADDSLFDPVRRAAEALGIDLQRWKGVSDPYRIGLVTAVGNVEDGTLNQAAYEGLKRAAGGFNVETAIVESVQPGDFQRNVELFASEGYDLVITVGSQLGEVTQAVAEAHPATRFAIVDHPVEAELANLKGLTFREDQAGFLAGALAGLMSKSGTAALVAREEGPAARRFSTGYQNGVACVCSSCEVITVFVNAPTDPIQGRTAALGVIGEGADVVTGIGGAVGAGAIQGAAQDDAWAIGADIDHYVTTFESGKVEGAHRLLSSALKRGDEAVYDTIKSLVGGAFASGTGVYGVAHSGITLAPFHESEADVTDDVKATLERIQAGLAQGALRTGVDLSTGELIAGEAPEPGACLLTGVQATPAAPQP
jgi:basic membrane protein A